MAEQTEQPGRTIMPSASDRRTEADRRLRERRLPDGMSRHEGPAGEEVFLDENLRPRRQWLTASIELVVFFALALLFDTLVLDGSRFLEVEPNPFWIAVIVLTVQYGTSYGLLAAIKGAAGYEQILIDNYPEMVDMKASALGSSTAAMQRMGPQFVGHLLMIVLIVIGNIIFFIDRKRGGA